MATESTDGGVEDKAVTLQVPVLKLISFFTTDPLARWFDPNILSLT